MSRNSWLVLIIVVFFLVGLYLILPPNGVRLGRDGFRLGLDLKGGTQLVYEADLSKKDPTLSDSQVMSSVKTKITRRVDAFGVSEPLIQIGGNNTILVQLPGVKDINQAKQLIGQTGLLKFQELSSANWDGSGNLLYTQNGQPVTVAWDGVSTPMIQSLTDQGQIAWVEATAVYNGQTEALTGRLLNPNSQVTISTDPSTINQPQVAFEWNSEGTALFQQVTSALLAQNKAPLGIFLDNSLISAPRVQAVIGSKGVITGSFTLDSAKALADTLNSGSLDVPLTVIAQQDVDATQGADSLRKSLFAGFIGLGMVLVFMVVSYRGPGVFAGMALLVYGSVLLSIFKMLPVTMSLPGIAGVIISIGMAVDANVLVFERLKEELRSGISYRAAVEKGFDRAWPSIRDSNISTFITCAILYWFGSTFGASMVQGFALTLFIGVFVSMLTALFVTRTFMRVFIGGRTMRPAPAAKATV
jgi:preprotein translocase subunit SecD